MDKVLELIDEAARTGATELELSFTDLRKLPKELFELKQLTALHLSGNQFTELPRELLELKQLTTLDLSHNQLTELPKELFELKQLTTLFLSVNQLTELPKELFELKQLTTLDLSHNQLTELPKELFELTQLSVLNLDYNSLAELPVQIGQLTKLTELYLNESGLSTLPVELFELVELTMLQITGCSLYTVPADLKNLTELTNLRLDNCGLTDLPVELFDLAELRELDLDNNELTKLPTQIGQLAYLTDLRLHNNQLTSLPIELFELTELEFLDLDNNELTKLSTQIGQLANLNELFLESNKLTHLPPQLGSLVDVQTFRIDGNPLEVPPLEIAHQGIPAIRDYFEELEKTRERQNLFEAKLLIIGDGEAGKTSFKRKIKDTKSKMPEDRDTTRGIDVDTWTFPCHDEQGKDVNFRVNLWDFGGQELYRGTHQMFFSKKSYYVLLADTRKQGNDYSYWLNTVEQLAGEESSVLILLNEKHGHTVKFDDKGYKGRFGNIIKDVRALDLKNDTAKINQLRDHIKLHLQDLPGIGDPLPLTWIEVRELLAAERRIHHYISFDRFKEICKSKDITKPSVLKTLSGYYTRIGVFTHYIDDSLLAERVYLNSNWLLDTVYKVLEADVARDNNGRLSGEDIKAIWGEIDFDVEFELDRLSKLMHKFGLMYQVDDTEEYVVPAHLPNKPYNEWPRVGDILHFEYKFDKYMPPGIMSRLIVALHHLIADHSLVWRNGVNLKLNETYAEITESLGAENAFKIRVVGSDSIELLAVIRSKFAEVLRPFVNLNYEQLLPCNCNTCSASDLPAFHEYSHLLKMRKLREGSQCDKTGKVIPVNQLLLITSFEIDEEKYTTSRKTSSTGGASPDNAKTAKPKKIELFLASSNELEGDRIKFENLINKQNKALHDDGIFLHLNIWEDALGAMSKTRKQDDYNRLVERSDIFVALFQNKVGNYSEEEFDVAVRGLKNKNKPRYIYTFFKEPSYGRKDKIAHREYGSVIEFQEKLDELGHFYDSYDSVEDLQLQFERQLREILKELKSGG